jgi:hypothetical protein
MYGSGMRIRRLAAVAIAAGSVVITAAGCGSSNYVGLQCGHVCGMAEQQSGARPGVEVVYASKPNWWDAAPDCEGTTVPKGYTYCRR